MNTSSIPGSVTVGVDGSPGSDVALRWAVAHAAARHRRLAVVHATGVPRITPFDIGVDEVTEGYRADGERVLTRALDLVRGIDPDLEVETHLELRDAREVLAERAADAAVLVVGSRGRGPVASLVLGSVSVALAAHAPCPVVVVRPPSEDDDEGQRPVVVGADGTAGSAGALAFGFELAAQQGRRLEVLYAVGEAWVFPSPDLVDSTLTADTLRDGAVVLAESLAGYHDKHPDVVVRSRVLRGSPTQALVAASELASTVVVGARGRSVVQRTLLGSVSRSVVERAHCTVAVVADDLS